MVSRSTVLGALVVAELAIAGMAVQAVAGPHRFGPVGFAAAAQSAALDRTFVTGPAPHVVLRLGDARIAVRAVAASTVRIVEMTHTMGWPHQAPVPLHAERTPDGVLVTLENGPSGFFIGGYSRTVTVEVPPGARVEGTTNDGSVSADGLRAPLKLATSDGAITVSDQRGDCDLSTSDGSIRLSNVRADRLVGATSDGSIRGSGVRLVDGSLTTSDGSVRVAVGADSDAVVDVRTDDGSLHVDAALRPGADDGDSDGDRHHRSAVLGSGRGRFTLASSDGSVTLSRESGV